MRDTSSRSEGETTPARCALRSIASKYAPRAVSKRPERSNRQHPADHALRGRRSSCSVARKGPSRRSPAPRPRAPSPPPMRSRPRSPASRSRLVSQAALDVVERASADHRKAGLVGWKPPLFFDPAHGAVGQTTIISAESSAPHARATRSWSRDGRTRASLCFGTASVLGSEPEECKGARPLVSLVRRFDGPRRHADQIQRCVLSDAQVLRARRRLRPLPAQRTRPSADAARARHESYSAGRQRRRRSPPA